MKFIKKTNLLIILCMIFFAISCGDKPEKHETEQQEAIKNDDFQYQTEQFADLRILRYHVPGFDKLNLNQKKLVYYLYEAGCWGREIFYDQNYKHNLFIKNVLENIVLTYTGDKETDDFKKFMTYTKRFWFSNGIHHHYANDKFVPGFSQDYFAGLIKKSSKEGFPLEEGQTIEQMIEKITPLLFDPNIAAKKINQDPQTDMVATSAVNFYEGVTQAEVETYYDNISDKESKEPLSYGLNSKVIKENGEVKEKVYKLGGMYHKAIEKIVYWLEKAAGVAENEQQKQVITKLIEFYKTGDLKTFDEYSILWVQATDLVVDFTNGFIEVYSDPLGYKGAWQSTVYIEDTETTKKFEKIASEAAWFEQNSPIMDEHKKDNAKGVSFKVINVVAEAGDCAPVSPLGVNLPNANWIRSTYGSKSVSLNNISHAYDEASKTSGMLEEFYTPQQVERQKKYGSIADKLHTGLHEVIGHGSGKLMPGVGTPNETLKNYASPLEEARADLVALYYAIDQHLVDIGVSPGTEAGKAMYDDYIVNGLMKQMVRLEPGSSIEQAHMRNRQLIAKWTYEKGQKDNVIERKTIDGKTFFVINDYEKLRRLFGELLCEVQRIKSEGDYEAGKALVENYGIQLDHELHNEVLKRFKKLNIAAYSGFIQPVLRAVKQGSEIVDIKIEYPTDFTEQMLFYAKNYNLFGTRL